MAGDKFSGGLDELTRAGARALGKTVTAIVAGVAELPGKIFGEREPEVAAASEGHSAGGGIMGWVKEAITGASLDVKEAAPSKQTEVAVAAVVSPHHADPADLGNFSPPTFGNAGAGISAGRSA